MAEILLGQSYYLRFDPKLWEAMQPYPPLGTLYAASYLRQRGYDVALFDAMLAASEEEWAAAIDREKPRYAVLFEDNFNYLSKMCLLRMRQAAFTMISMARRRGCEVIVCGSDASDHAVDYLEHGAQYVLAGEGEATLGELIESQSGKNPLPVEDIKGLYFLDRQGKLAFTPRRPDLSDLDALPFPAWDLVDIPRYRSIWLEKHGYFSMNMVTTRGCPFHCNWCAKPIWGQRYHVRSPESVVAEMEWLKEHYQPDHMWFVDDILGLKPGWLEHFASIVEQAGVRIPFKSLNRVDLLLRGDAVSALARAGAQIVWVGAESGSQKILDAMEKGTRVEQVYQAVRKLHEAGVQVGFFLQFGYPGEDLKDIEKTWKMVHDCHPDDIGISVSYPLPGTKFFAAVQQQLGQKQNWVDSQDLEMLYQGPYGTQFYRQLHAVTHKQFRIQKSWDKIRQVIHHPSQARRDHFLLAGKLLYHVITLPVDRWILNRLKQQPYSGAAPLPPALSPEAASQPTPQAER